MYQSTQDASEYIKRTGNHSTKGSRRGFAYLGFVFDEESIEADSADVIQRLVDQRKQISKERGKLLNQLIPAGSDSKTWLRNVRYKYKGRERLLFPDKKRSEQLKEVFRLGVLEQDVCRQISDAKKRGASKRTSTQTVSSLFVDLAEKLLDESVFVGLLESAKQQYKKQTVNSPEKGLNQ